MSTSSPYALAVSAASYIVAPESVSADQLAAMALALIADAGLPKTEVVTSVSRYRDGRLSYSVCAYDLCAARNPLNIHTAYGLANTADDALRQLSTTLAGWAERTGLRELPTVAAPAPVAEASKWATANQRMRIVRLLNHPNVSRAEKSRVLVGINRLSEHGASAEIARLEEKTGLDKATRFAPQYAVRGEAYQVAPSPAA